MDIGKWIKKFPQILTKYRYPLVLVLAGLILLNLPIRKESSSQPSVPTEQIIQPNTEESLTQILAQMQGVGRVKIMLTVMEGERMIYQADEDVTTGDNNSTVRNETIILTDSERNQHALISQILAPRYLGAVIVCQGADDPSVKWAVVEAVSKATGLGADRISVLKMK